MLFLFSSFAAGRDPGPGHGQPAATLTCSGRLHRHHFSHKLPIREEYLNQPLHVRSIERKEEEREKQTLCIPLAYRRPPPHPPTRSQNLRAWWPVRHLDQ